MLSGNHTSPASREPLWGGVGVVDDADDLGSRRGDILVDDGLASAMQRLSARTWSTRWPYVASYFAAAATMRCSWSVVLHVSGSLDPRRRRPGQGERGSNAHGGARGCEASHGRGNHHDGDGLHAGNAQRLKSLRHKTTV